MATALMTRPLDRVPRTASDWTDLCRPFWIGGVEVNPPVALAPMADVTNGPFRRLCKRIGNPGLLVTEQISTMAIHYRNAKTLRMFDWTEEERPLAVQLFGGDPAVMAEAARIVADLGADIVDINMGCWVPKVCKTGSGAALLREPEQAIRVVESVVRAVQVPVTVKMRAGWTAEALVSTRLAREFELRGARAFTLHARTAKQGFGGSADWAWISEIKAAVSVPVLGNGDVAEPRHAAEMIRFTGCDGVMIGRAAIGNPWMLRRTSWYLRTGADPGPPTIAERIAAAVEHARALASLWDEETAVRHLRGQLPYYVKGCNGASAARERIVRARTLAEVESTLKSVGPGTGQREHALAAT
jgi:nifR3 family TIM-barrel protein